MKNLLRFAFIAIAAAVFVGSLMHVTSAQKSRDRFSHNTAAHKKKSCNSCHSNPTSNWVTARGYPDVADFPQHVACFACHTKDIYSGNQPAFCGSCHTVVGPRGKARFPFPVRTRTTEFSTIYPHNVHQDIIAAVDKRLDVSVAHFVFASFVPADDKPTFNNCSICHATRKELPKFAARSLDPKLQPLGDAAPETFAPKADYFKDSPSGHASCFNCHFQGLQPSGIDCAKCHKLEPPSNPTALVSRYSLKFSHEDLNDRGETVHNRDCMTCHVRISQNADLKTMKDADVPFMACASCHADNFTKENNSRADSIAKKQPAFQCTYCHTTAIGRFPMPPSHKTQ